MNNAILAKRIPAIANQDQVIESVSSLWRRYLHIYVFIILYIEFSRQVTVHNQIPGIARIAIMLAISIPLVLRMATKRIDKRSISLFAILSCMLFLSIFRDDDGINTFILWVAVLVGFLIASSIHFKEFASTLCNVVCFLAAFSLPCYLLSMLAPNIVSAFPMLGYMSESTAQVHDMFFSVAIINCQTFRNPGITWEPGAFSILLSVALLFCFVFKFNHNKVRVCLLVITLLTTFSTLGYILLALILSVQLLRKTSDPIMKKIALALLGIIALAVIFSFTEAGDVVFGKLEGLFSDTGGDVAETTQSRIDAIVYPGLAFLESPIAGVGYDRFYEINVTQCNSVAVNTIVNWFALGGIAFGAPCLFFYLRSVYSLGRIMALDQIPLMLLLLASIVLLSTESMLRISLVYVFIIYGCNATCVGGRRP